MTVLILINHTIIYSFVYINLLTFFNAIKTFHPIHLFFTRSL